MSSHHHEINALVLDTGHNFLCRIAEPNIGRNLEPGIPEDARISM